MPLASLLTIATSNAGKTTTFGPSNTSMWIFGVICSTLYYGSRSGLISLILAPFWVIYSSVNALIASMSWNSYTSIITSYLFNYIDYLIQSYFLCDYHYSTGFLSVLIFSLIKKYALSSNLAGMSTTDTSSANVAQRNSYAFTTSIGVMAGLIFGAFGIIPTMVLGILTFPITLPIVIWKEID